MDDCGFLNNLGARTHQDWRSGIYRSGYFIGKTHSSCLFAPQVRQTKFHSQAEYVPSNLLLIHVVQDIRRSRCYRRHQVIADHALSSASCRARRHAVNVHVASHEWGRQDKSRYTASETEFALLSSCGFPALAAYGLNARQVQLGILGGQRERFQPAGPIGSVPAAVHGVLHENAAKYDELVPRVWRFANRGW